ncbi:MAG: hypothetical protein JWM59_1300 [Verrucomicrobiales bacterium]|nr:hypothetical protein [Verrucomicrobiales bacterium]
MNHPDSGTTATKGGSVSRNFQNSSQSPSIHSMKSENLSIIPIPSPSSRQIAKRAPEHFPLLRILLVPPAPFTDALAGGQRALLDRDLYAVAERADRQRDLALAIARARQARSARDAAVGMVMMAAVFVAVAALALAD